MQEAILKNILLKNKIDTSKIDVIPDEANAVEASLSMAKEGDLVLILGDEIIRCWKQIVHFDNDENHQKIPSAYHIP